MITKRPKMLPKPIENSKYRIIEQRIFFSKRNSFNFGWSFVAFFVSINQMNKLTNYSINWLPFHRPSFLNVQSLIIELCKKKKHEQHNLHCGMHHLHLFICVPSALDDEDIVNVWRYLNQRVSIQTKAYF